MMIDSTQIIFHDGSQPEFFQGGAAMRKAGMRGYFQNNKPKYVLMDVDAMEVKLPATDENLDAAAKKELERAQWL